MFTNCLYAPNGDNFMENRAFSCYAQACEGDFTVGRQKLDQVAGVLAYNWVYNRQNPNDTNVCKNVCNQMGFDFNILTVEEVDYLSAKTEQEIAKYGA